MNKKDLINKVTETLRDNNIRKHISSSKNVFHISDNEGNKKDFVVKHTDKYVQFNSNDIKDILDVLLYVIEDSLKKGEEISVQGFGTLGLNYRAARKTKHPDTGEWIDVSARYIPKFTFGKSLRTAAKIYELSQEGK